MNRDSIKTMVTLAFTLLALLHPRVVAKEPEPPLRIQDEVRKTLRDLYKADYAERKVDDVRAFASKLYNDALAPSTQGGTRYVMLREVIELATRAYDVNLALEALDELVAGYEVPELRLRSETCRELKKPAAREPASAIRLTRRFLGLVDVCVTSARFDLTSELVKDATDMARRTGERRFVAGMRSLKKYLETLEREHQNVRDALAAESPSEDDTDTNLAVGRFLCFFLGDWTRGVEFLAKGVDAELAMLAAKELASPELPDEQMEIGEAWWARARRAKGLERQRLLGRSAYWYGAALPETSGLAAIEIAKRLGEVNAGLEPFIPLQSTRFALDLDGASYVSVPSFKYDGSHPLTVEAIVEVDDTSRSKSTVVGNKSRSGFAISIERGGYWFFVFHAGGDYHAAKSDDPVEIGRPTHIAGVFDGRQLRLFVDGKLQAQGATVLGAHTPSMYPLTIGGDPQGKTAAEDFFDGRIEALRLSRRARYGNKGFAPPESLSADTDTILVFQFEEYEGKKTGDSSGAGHHGLVRGAERVGLR